MSESSLEMFNSFKETWEEQIKKIENQVLDNRAVMNIYNFFQNDERALLDIIPVMQFIFSNEMYQEIYLLESRLVVALETARIKYSLQNKTLWVRVIEGISKIVYRMPKSIEFKSNSTHQPPQPQ
jgi:hypothetical protein